MCQQQMITRLCIALGTGTEMLMLSLDDHAILMSVRFVTESNHIMTLRRTHFVL